MLSTISTPLQIYRYRILPDQHTGYHQLPLCHLWHRLNPVNKDHIWFPQNSSLQKCFLKYICWTWDSFWGDRSLSRWPSLLQSFFLQVSLYCVMHSTQLPHKLSSASPSPKLSYTTPKLLGKCTIYVFFFCETPGISVSCDNIDEKYIPSLTPLTTQTPLLMDMWGVHEKFEACILATGHKSCNLWFC